MEEVKEVVKDVVVVEGRRGIRSGSGCVGGVVDVV